MNKFEYTAAFLAVVKKYGVEPYLDRFRKVFPDFEWETDGKGEAISAWVYDLRDPLDPTPLTVEVNFENKNLQVTPWEYGEPDHPYSKKFSSVEDAVEFLENEFSKGN